MDAIMQRAMSAKPMALVGASNDPEKFGNIILRYLRRHGVPTFAVNPRGGEIDGEPVYTKLADCPEKPALVVFVVGPQVGINQLDSVKALGLDAVWLQPGTVSDALRDRARELGIHPIEACIMVEMDRAGL